MALKTPYATVAEADVYLSDSDAWSDLDASEKNTHLLNGRYYIDSNYSCTELSEDEVIPDEYKYANSLLALYDSSSSIFAVSATNDNSLVKTKVVAGPVSTEKVYSGYGNDSKVMIDKYPQITSLLSGYCSLDNNSGIKTSYIIRG